MNYDIRNKKILGAMKMGNIVRLNLSACYIAGSILLEIAALCPQLTAVVLSSLPYRGLTDDLLRKFTALCPHIVHLDVFIANSVTDAGMLSVVQNLKGLQSLRFSALHKTSYSVPERQMPPPEEAAFYLENLSMYCPYSRFNDSRKLDEHPNRSIRYIDNQPGNDDRLLETYQTGSF
eukprot:gene12403-14354_t